jgi:hypothetical protein
MRASNASIAVLVAISLFVALIAIRRSRDKLQTVFYIIAGVLGCGVVGAVIGLAPVNSDMAGLLALFFGNIVVIAIVEVIRIRRGSERRHTIFYIGTVIIACGLTGTVIRLAFANSHAAGTLAAVFMLLGGIAVSIEQIRKYNNLGLT